MKFKSKVHWLYYIIVFLFSYCTFRVCYNFSNAANTREHSLLMLLFVFCEFIVLLPIMFLTYYTLDEDSLHVQSGYFTCRQIPYEDIVKLRDTKSIFSAGGLGLERIEITYKYKDSIDTVLISPRELEKVKKLLTDKVKNDAIKDLSEFAKPENETKNQPMNGIIH